MLNIAIITMTNNSNNSNNSNNLFFHTLTHKSSILGLILSLRGGKHSYIREAAIAAKIL